MSTVTAPVSAPPEQRASQHNYWLLAGGYFSLAFAIFQLSAIWWKPGAIRYFGGPAKLSVERPLIYTALCVGFAIIVALFGIYALSGGGSVRHLPLLRTALVTMTVVYLLRGLILVPQILVTIRHPEFIRFLLFSVIAFCVGIVHLIGTIGVFRTPRQQRVTET